jgi:dipeptidyl aminopeptidase/acylaminoacyl peptidase
MWLGQAPAVPFAVYSSIGIPRLTYLDDKAPDAILHKTLSAQFPNQHVNFINFTDDGQKLLFSVLSDRDPGSYYLFDRKTGKADLLFANMELIDPEQMGERRPINFTARDGMTITGYLTLPKSPGSTSCRWCCCPMASRSASPTAGFRRRCAVLATAAM